MRIFLKNLYDKFKNIFLVEAELYEKKEMEDKQENKKIATVQKPQAPQRSGLPKIVEGIDYYWEGRFMVMTEHYLLKRGYCCTSGCRHCPYKKEQES